MGVYTFNITQCAWFSQDPLCADTLISIIKPVKKKDWKAVRRVETFEAQVRRTMK